MKGLASLLLIGLNVLTGSLYGQHYRNRFINGDDNNVHLGFKASLAAGIMDFRDIAPLPAPGAVNKLRFTYDFGMYAEWIPKDGIVGAQTEIFFGKRGGRISYQGGYYNFNTQYLFIPFFIKVYLQNPLIELYIGPQLGLLAGGLFTSQSSSAGPLPDYAVPPPSQAVLTDYYKKTDFSLSTGVTYHISSELSVDGRATISLTSDSNFPSRPYNSFIYKTVQVGVRYFIDLGAGKRAEYLRF